MNRPGKNHEIATGVTPHQFIRSVHRPTPIGGLPDPDAPHPPRSRNRSATSAICSSRSSFSRNESAMNSACCARRSPSNVPSDTVGVRRVGRTRGLRRTEVMAGIRHRALRAVADAPRRRPGPAAGPRLIQRARWNRCSRPSLAYRTVPLAEHTAKQVPDAYGTY